MEGKDDCCLKMARRIERFYRIVRKDFVQNILHLHHHHLLIDKQHRKGKLNGHFARLDSKQDVCQYQQLYCLARSDQQFLLVNGMIRSNDHFDRSVDLLCEQYETFYHLMSECHLTMLLLVQPFHQRNISDHELLMEMARTFETYRHFAINQQQSIRSTMNGKRSNLIQQIATHPQYDDLRQLFGHYERHQFGRMIRDQYDNLYYGYHHVYDSIIKNGNILGSLLRHSYHHQNN